MAFIPQTVPFVALPTSLRGRITPHQLSVLWVLQSYHPNIWPSIRRVAADTGLSKRQVQYVIQQLVERGWLTVVRRTDNEDGGNQSNVYHVTIWHECRPEPQSTLAPDTPSTPPPGAAPAPPLVQDMHPPGASPAPPLVQAVHPPGAGHAPKQEQRELKQEELKTNKTVDFAQTVQPDTTGQNQPDAPSGKKRGRKPRAAVPYTPEFDAFWRTYQAIERRASGQSKPLAWDQYRTITASVACEALQGALNAAIREQAATERKGGFAAPFPDCFRWLRDGRHEAHLSSAAVAPQRQPWQDAPDGMPF